MCSSLVRELEHAVEGSRLACIRDTRPGAGTVDRGRARIREAGHAVPLRRFENVRRPDDVDGGAAWWIGLHEREEQRSQMHDVRDAVLADRPLDLFEVGDVAVDERQLFDLLRRHDELEPASVRAEVVQNHRNVLAHELCARPGADAPERTGDQEAFFRHAS